MEHYDYDCHEDTACTNRRANGLLLALALLLMLTAAPLTVQAAPGAYLFEWGAKYHFATPASPGNEYNGPYGITVDAAGNILVVDSGHGLVKVYTQDGTYVRTIGSGALATGMGWPHGLGLDESGNIYVADTFEHRIQVYTSSGTYLRSIGGRETFPSLAYPDDALVSAGYVYVSHGPQIEVFRTDGDYVTSIGSPGSAPGQLNSPTGMTMDSAGQLYVADTVNDRISIFTTSGSFVRTIGSSGSGDGELSRPIDLALDGQGNLFVVDSYNHRVSVFTEQGQFLRSFGSYGTGPGQLNYPKGIAVTNGKVYIGDSLNGRVMVFTVAGAFVEEWPSKGSGNGEFHSVYGVALDQGGGVVVSDTENNRLQAFTGTGQFLWSAGSMGSGEGQFRFPGDLSVAPSGTIVVADSQNDRVAVLDSNGAFLRHLTGDMSHPTDVAVDASGNLYVVDSSNGTIDVFSDAGVFLRNIGSRGVGDGELYYPTGAAVDRDGNVYVADTDNHRIQVFSNAGTFLRGMGSSGSGPGQLSRPCDVAVDHFGNVYVADSDNDRIVVFTSAGAFRGSWGTLGDQPGQFRYPRSVAVDAAGSRVYVADTGNNRIQVFAGYGMTVPTGSVMINGGAATTTSAQVTLTLSASPGVTQMQFSKDGGAHWYGWESFATTRIVTLVPPGDGVKSISVRFRDTAGTLSAIYTDFITLTAPRPTGSILINGGASYCSSLNVTLTLAASSTGATVVQMQFSKDSGQTWYGWENFATTRKVQLAPAGDGTKSISVRFRDSLGRVSDVYSDSITLLTAAPTGSITINSGAAYCTSREVTLSLSANSVAGVTGMRFSKDGGATWFPWESFAAIRKVTLTAGDGVKVVTVLFRDSAGNISTPYADSISYDTIPPSGTITINGGAATTSSLYATLTLSASDASGVTQMQFSKNGVNWYAWEPYSTTRNVTLTSGAGTKTMYVRYKDGAGRISASYSDSIAYSP